MAKVSTVLLVEDSSDDVALVLRAFRKGRVPNPVYVVHDGREALAYLAGEGKYADRAAYPAAALVLLDLSLPDIGGFEVLRWIRREFKPNELRVIVLTGSVNLDDARMAYDLGADSFLMKPLEFENAVEIGTWLRESWLRATPEERGDQSFPEVSLPWDGLAPGEAAA